MVVIIVVPVAALPVSVGHIFQWLSCFNVCVQWLFLVCQRSSGHCSPQAKTSVQMQIGRAHV